MTLFKNIWASVIDSSNNDVVFQILLIVITIDFITGVARGIRDRKFNSTTGINGWIRHGIVIIVTSVVHYFSTVLGAGWFSYAFATGFIVEYIASIAENWGLLGYPLPDNVAEILDKLDAPKFKDVKHDKNDDDKLKKLGNKLFDNKNDKGDDVDE